MELPDGRFVAVDDEATDEHYRLGAELARKRIRRWYWAVLAEYERRRECADELAASRAARSAGAGR